MNEPTTTRGHDRYADFSEADFDSAIAWLQNQGSTAWCSRLKHDGDWVKVDMRGMPPLMRQIVHNEFDALELMSPAQVRQIVDGTLEDRIRVVDQVLTEAGR